MNLDYFVESLPKKTFIYLLKACNKRVINDLLAEEYEEDEEECEEDEEECEEDEEECEEDEEGYEEDEEECEEDEIIVLNRNEKALVRSSNKLQAIRELHRRNPELPILKCKKIIDIFEKNDEELVVE